MNQTFINCLYFIMHSSLRLNRIIRFFSRPLLTISSVLLTAAYALGQAPVNDNCANAIPITISNAGFGLGVFNSANTDISKATIQTGESFASAIFTAKQNQKSVWYVFTLPTTRSVTVTLTQAGSAIADGDAGFAVYKTSNCLPGPADISTKLTAIPKFGYTFNPCVDAGVYLIQVSSNNNANGILGIQLSIKDSTGALYDHPAQAYDFGKLSSFLTHIDYQVECQSLENAAEACTSLGNYKQYTKSSWHTFTTPAYFDFVGVFLSSANTNCLFSQDTAIIGYNLYKGDVKVSPYGTLPVVDGCDSFKTNGLYADKKLYRCSQLLPNTTYSIQLFFNETFNDNIRLSVIYEGTAPTRAPQPTLAGIPVKNQFGNVTPTPNGITKSDSDYLACNSRHAVSSCGPSLPLKPIYSPNYSYGYDMSTFFTFTLNAESNVIFNAYALTRAYYISSPPLYVRVFNQGVTNNCNGLDTNNIIGEFVQNGKLTCLAPGNYTVQVMGTDSLLPYDYYYCSYLSLANGINYDYPVFSDLGQQISLQCTFTSINPLNKYSLSNNKAYDTVNSMKALLNGIAYVSKEDTFGCANTVLPVDGKSCNMKAEKAIYREFTIGDANGDGKLDSGVLVLSNYLGYYSYGASNYSILYAGDASQLANAQNAHFFPDSIKGLIPYTTCLRNPGCTNLNVCIIPGTYTLASIADSNYTGVDPGSTGIQFNLVSTQHYNGTTAQNLGSIMDTLGVNGGTKYTDIDYFSCLDNAVSIGGYAPPIYYTDTTTKAIYREFYLKDNAVVNVTNYFPYYSCDYAPSLISIFSGKASDGLNTLKIIPINGKDSSPYSLITPTCNPLPAGWYTVVAYGLGPTYSNHSHNAIYSDSYSHPYDGVGRKQQLSITITPACPAPKYNQPLKAAVDTLTKAPFLFKWAPRAGSTPAYPKTDTTYTLYTENFNCSINKPFPSYLKPCDTLVNRVAYYVFQITQESYIQINTNNYWGEVYALDIRKDSAKFGTTAPIQPCLQSNGHIELCRLQPGYYTLVIFAGDNNVYNGCGSVTPSLYIDNTGYSRFDNAVNAYDFGVIPPDSAYHNGKVGDVNPFDPSRAPSNDFFYCTTGAQKTDPTDADCGVVYTPSIYNVPSTNNHLFDTDPGYDNQAKRNLWYSFVVDKPGYITVKVDNKTPGKLYQYPFAVYRGTANDSLPISTLAATGRLDSTTKGLSFIIDNLNYYYCYTSNTVSFYVDPCSFTTPVRYYIIVNNRSNYAIGDFAIMAPSSQVEVSVLLDSVFALKPKYDHYYQADTIGLNLGAGVYTGAKDNFTCASADPNDPVTLTNWPTCNPKTLWYKFTVGVTGYIRYKSIINNKPTDFGYNDVYLFQQTIPGDSTPHGFSYTYPSYYRDSANNYWGQQCVSPGTYYLVTSGCSRVNEDFQPVIWLTEQTGDFCSKPVVATLKGPGSSIVSALINCHTIGTDYGEYGPNLTCPPGKKTTDYKSSWFRIDVTGKDTLDVTAYIVENTNASSSDINYRLMTGDCGAMQETSCVQDALTQNTYRCLAPGSYYIQVFSPVMINGQLDTGMIELHVNGVLHADTCAPEPKCLAIAQFSTLFDCTTDSAVRFVNASTYGTNIRYKWEFGNNGDTSNAVSPSYFYPVLATDKTYTAKLLVENTSCGGKDSVSYPVKIPGRPYVNLGPDIFSCNPDTTVTLKATSFPGATYYWQNGSTNPTFQVNQTGKFMDYVAVTYNGCVSRDTVNFFINPITKSPVQNLILCKSGDSIMLYDFKSNYWGSETYTWNTGVSGLYNYYIYAYTPGLYTVDVSYNGCGTTDSFYVASPNSIHPLGSDTAVCLSASAPYLLNAGISGASSYLWQDGSRGSTFQVTTPGKYSVTISIGSCSVTDSVNISSAVPAAPVITGNLKICSGDSALLDAGKGFAKYVWDTGDSTEIVHLKTAGSHTVTVYNAVGCQASSLPVQVVVNPLPVPKILGNKALCNADTIQLDGGGGYSTYAWSSGESTETVRTAKTGKLVLKVTDANGCQGSDSVMVNISPAATFNNISTTICFGKSYLLPSGSAVTLSGTYFDTLRNISGCDSLITHLSLTVTAPLAQTIDTLICAGSSITLPSGTVVNKSGTYQDTVHAVSGCDSLTTRLNLTVITAIRVNPHATICAGNSYTLPSGNKVSVPGIYNDTLRAVSGCDSLITTLSLQVINPVFKNMDVTICAGKVFTLPSGTPEGATGVYQDTVRTLAGCDSLITTLHLTVVNPLIIDTSVTICAGSSFTLPSGKSVGQPGNFHDTLRTALGCDSLITNLNLRVVTPVLNSVQASICSGSTFTLPSGTRISSAGSYQDTVRAVSGCDSLITSLDLIVISPVFLHTQASICAGAHFLLPSGRSVGAAGLYQDTVRTLSGCDSLITTLQLAVVTPLRVSTNASICAGSFFTLPSGVLIRNAGIYQDTVRTVSGCDSLITTCDLAVVSPLRVAASASICQGRAYTLPSGRLLTAAGSYQDTLRTLAGCDSLITSLRLAVVVPLSVNTLASICQGSAYSLPSGRMVNLAGTYQDTVRTLAGCDSLITRLSLSIFQKTAATIDTALCAGKTLRLPSGLLLSNTGRYQDTLRSTGGCDSVIYTMNLTVNPSPTVDAGPDQAILVGSTLTLQPVASPDVIAWNWQPPDFLSCANCPAPLVTPLSPVTYIVQVTNSEGCSATDTISISLKCSGSVVFIPNTFTPDGDGLNDIFYPRGRGIKRVNYFRVFNRWGELIFEQKNFNIDDRTRGWDGRFNGKYLPPDVFVYTTEMVCDNNETFLLKGTIMIIR